MLGHAGTMHGSLRRGHVVLRRALLGHGMMQDGDRVRVGRRRRVRVRVPVPVVAGVRAGPPGPPHAARTAAGGGATGALEGAAPPFLPSQVPISMFLPGTMGGGGIPGPFFLRPPLGMAGWGLAG